MQPFTTLECSCLDWGDLKPSANSLVDIKGTTGCKVNMWTSGSDALASWDLLEINRTCCVTTTV